MKKQIKKASFDDMLNKLNVLDSFIGSAYSELKILYKNDNYMEWSRLSKERHKLYLANNLIIKDVAEKKVQNNELSAETSEHTCGLSFYLAHKKSMEYKTMPELYQVHLEKMDANEREYIINQSMIDELNLKIERYNKLINDLLKKMDEYDVVLNYLLQQRSTFLFSHNIEILKKPLKMKIVEERLKRYSSMKAYIKQIKTDIEEMKTIKDSQYDLHSYMMKDMPKPLAGDKIPDPTFDTLINVINIYEKRLNNQFVLIEKAQRNVDWVESTLLSLDEDEKKVIELFYFKKYSWIRISMSMEISERTCYLKRDQALEKLIKII